MTEVPREFDSGVAPPTGAGNDFRRDRASSSEAARHGAVWDHLSIQGWSVFRSALRHTLCRGVRMRLQEQRGGVRWN